MGTSGEKLPREFYLRDGITVAEDLIGRILVHKTEEGITKGRIVEVEAYMGLQDKASHAYRGPRSGRTAVQYKEGGYAYLYFIYGMYHCVNIVANQKEVPEAILIRALEPVEGIPLMEKRRKTDKLKNLCSGPGKLCTAMGITSEQYGADLCGTTLYLEKGYEGERDFEVTATKRINIDYAEEAADYLWRFILKGNPHISVKPRE